MTRYWYAGHLPDGTIARNYGVSRRTVQRWREREGIPATRKPSPVADAIVAAVGFLRTAKASEIADFMGRRDRVARVNLYATLPKVAASGRIARVGDGVYSVASA